MIIPWLKGFVLPRQAPVTWAIFFVNLLVYLAFSFQSSDVDLAFDRYFNDNDMLKVQGLVFAQYVDRNPAQFSGFHRKLGERALAGHDHALQVLSSLAIRDRKFIDAAERMNVEGDEVAISRWKTKFSEFQKQQAKHPGNTYGLSDQAPNWKKYFSYQFVHSGYFHLVFNMVLLIIFGSFLESVVGSFAFLGLYLITGMAAALFYVQVSGLSSAPLVGASGAISGLIGFFSFLFWNRKVTYLYVLLPRQGYYGFANLPAWIFFALWVTGELASQIGHIPEVGGIAHSAHLGGVLSGLVFGGLFLGWRKASAQGVF